MIRNGFSLCNDHDVWYLKVPLFEQAGGVCCAFSTRIGGVSSPPYDTLNFSRKREQNEHNFQENLKRFGKAARFDPKNATCINYAHCAALYRVSENDAGCGIRREHIAQICDGLYTDTVNLPLISFHADCTPLFFYDPKRRSAAVCHAGWRGVAAHITRAAIEALVDMGSSPENILAAVGPCISADHFEVGADVRDIFIREFGSGTIRSNRKRYYADMNKACISDMLSEGIHPCNITDAGLCTYGDPLLFFSHRRDKGKTGAMAAVIMLI